jgi:prevent-host-death family protein
MMETQMERTTLPVSMARSNFSDLLNEVLVYGERVVLERHGKPVAALVSVSDLERLEALDEAGGGGTTP